MEGEPSGSSVVTAAEGSVVADEGSAAAGEGSAVAAGEGSAVAPGEGSAAASSAAANSNARPVRGQVEDSAAYITRLNEWRRAKQGPTKRKAPQKTCSSCGEKNPTRRCQEAERKGGKQSRHVQLLQRKNQSWSTYCDLQLRGG